MSDKYGKDGWDHKREQLERIDLKERFGVTDEDIDDATADEISDLRRQLEGWKADAKLYAQNAERAKQQLAEAQARIEKLERLLDTIGDRYKTWKQQASSAREYNARNQSGRLGPPCPPPVDLQQKLYASIEAALQPEPKEAE